MLRRLGRFVLRVLAVDALAAALTGAVCWGIGWRTWPEYGLALVVAGLLALMLAGPSFFGSVIVLGNPLFWYVQSVMPGDPIDRWRSLISDPNEPEAGAGLFTAAGLSLAALGLWVWAGV